MKINFKKQLNIFVIALAASVITLSYLSAAYVKKKCQPELHFELFFIFVPLIYGIFGLVNYYIVQKFGTYYSLLVGAIFGLLLSIIGRFVLNLPELLFNFTPKNEYMVHIIAALLYAVIFQFLITPVTLYLV
jgi:hypothetical protein